MKLDKIRKLLDIMDANDLAEIEIEEDGLKIRLRKNGSPSETVVTTVSAGEKPAAAPSAGTSSADTIKAPMVGTFYGSPSPDTPPYVAVGDSVTTDTVVCIVEAMKVMNEIKAGVDGIIAEILVATGSAVEYGHPMFRIEPA